MKNATNQRWYKNPKWKAAIKKIAENMKVLKFKADHLNSSPQIFGDTPPNLDREGILFLMQQLGYKWNAKTKVWVFEHYVYTNRPPIMKTLPELKSSGLAPKKIADGYDCWNGRGFIAVYNALDAKERRKYPPRKDLTFFQVFWKAKSHALSRAERDINITRTKWGWFYIDRALASVLQHSDLQVKEVKTIYVGQEYLFRFRSHAPDNEVTIALEAQCKKAHPGCKLNILDLTTVL
jgi:hypothetical protein